MHFVINRDWGMGKLYKLCRCMAGVAMLLLTGCAISPDFTGTTQPITSVQLDKLYIYSFLDVRANELGSTMMTEIERQLGEGLKVHGVESQQHWFERDPIASEFARSSYSSERVPVHEVIHNNAQQERAFGARYRLIAFPANTLAAGAWRHYDFNWVLEDSGTGQLVWSTTSRSKHMNWVKNDEDSAERAKVLVDAVLEEMASSGLFAPASTSAKQNGT